MWGRDFLEEKPGLDIRDSVDIKQAENHYVLYNGAWLKKKKKYLYLIGFMYFRIRKKTQSKITS